MDAVAAEDEAKEHNGKKETATVEPYETTPVGLVETGGTVTAVVSVYDGALNTLRSGLGAFLASEGVKPADANAGEARLLDSLLATADKNMLLDWKARESIQAKLKVTFKRVLVLFGTAPEKAREVAEHMLDWLCVQAAETVGTVNGGSLLVKGEKSL